MFAHLTLAAFAVFSAVELSNAGGGGHGGGHKHVVIHVPFKVKTIHHTHTVVKHVGDEGGGDYKVIGYSGEHGHDFHGGYEDHSGGFAGHSEGIGGGHGPSLVGHGGGSDWGSSSFEGGFGGGHASDVAQSYAVAGGDVHGYSGDLGAGGDVAGYESGYGGAEGGYGGMEGAEEIGHGGY